MASLHKKRDQSERIGNGHRFIFRTDVSSSQYRGKLITERGDGAEIIQELRAFWRFLQRVYQLPQASQMLARLTPQAARRLERELQEPANFGMVKSFVLMGKEAGFDMESPEGMRAWIQAYNATVAPTMAAGSRYRGPATNKKSRGVPKGMRNAQPR